MNSAEVAPVPRMTRMMRATIISYAGFVATFVSSVVVSRLLGVESKGVFSLFMASVGGLWIVATLGVSQGHLYHASRDRRWLSHFMANAIPFATVVGGLAGLAYFLGGRVLAFKPVVALPWLVVLAGVAAVPAGLLLTFQRQYFLALDRFELAKASGAVSQILPLIGFLGLYLTGQVGVTTFVGAFVAAQFLCFVAYQVPVGRVGPPTAGFSVELLKRAFSFGVPQYVSTIAMYLASRLDFFIVLLYLGEAGLGIYSVAVGLAEISIRLTNEIGTMLFPVFAGGKLKPGQPAVALRTVTLFAVGTATVLGLVSGPLVRVLFGEAFTDAVPAFRWLLVGTVAWSTINVTWQYVSARGRPGLGALVFGLAAAVDVLLNFLLLPRWGVVGASIAATSSYLVAAPIFLHFFRKSEGCSLREALVPQASDVRRLWKALSAAFGSMGTWRPSP